MGIILTVQYDDKTIKKEHNDNEWKTVAIEFKSPLVPANLTYNINSDCWILYQNWFGKWKVKEEIVTSICFTNIWSYRFRNHGCLPADELGSIIFLHDELEKAIDECTKRNIKRKIKRIRW